MTLSGPAGGVFDRTVLAGMAARLAVHIRGVDVIDDPRRLYAVADRLGISSLILPRVLGLLEEAEFVSVQYKGEQPSRVIDRVPLFGDVYGGIGEVWRSKSPREEELATVQLLQELIDAPKELADVERATSLDPSQLKLVLDVGRSGGYIAQFTGIAASEALLYSPLYWEENPEQTFLLIQKWGATRIAAALRRVKEHQGMPIVDAGHQGSDEDRIIIEAMAAGLLPSPEVNSTRGPKKFAFTPYQGQIGLEKHERAILQKARALLACVRYGEHYGSVTRINDPGAIIRALRSRGSIGPHTEIARQYAMLVVEGIARISPDSTFKSRYHLHLIDTPENKKALQLAAELVEVGEAISDRGLDVETRNVLFGAGSIKDASTTRAEVVRTGRAPEFDSSLIRRELAKLIEQVREPA